MHNKKITVFSLIVLLSLMMSLVFPTGVLADDNPPPSTETPEVVTPPEETPTQEAAADTVVPESMATEVPVLIEETATPEPAVDTGSTVNDVALLSQLPEGTEVVVLNENGDPVSLASQEAAEIAQTVDPMWCPQGVAPGGTGCTISFSDSQALIDDMDASNPVTSNSIYEQHGIIYFTVNPGSGSFTLESGSGLLLNANDYNILKSYNLILQGGWDGTNGTGATFTGQTDFGTNPLTVGSVSNPWGGNITLNNFVFSGVSTSNAVKILTAGNITLDNVTANLTSSNFDAVRLDNTSGNGSVTVTGSTFNQTIGDDGMLIESNGLITLVNVSANQNGGYGADIYNNFNGTTQGVFVINSTFSDNIGNDGLRVASRGNITLINVTAQNNNNDGVDLSANNGANVILCGGTFSGNNAGGGANDYNVRAAGTTRTYSNDIVVNSWSPLPPTGWTSVTNGTAPCNYPDTDADKVPDQWDTDDDNDGVLDAADLCPGTAAGATVDANGCPLDTTPPVVTVPSNMTVEATSSSGAAVTFTASALDAVSGALTPTCLPASGSTFAIATTTVTCSATDSAGNTGSASFSITVQDTTPPVVTVPSNITVGASGPTGSVVTFTASALDTVDGVLSPTCLPASGSTFAIGTTTVTCSATDAHGNMGSASFTVSVGADTTPPVVTVPSNMTVEATSSSGATVTFTASALDAVSGALTPTCLPASSSTFAIATTTVTCSATDSAGNTGSASFSITVRDTTPPVVTVPSNMTVEATGSTGAAVTFTASALDAISGVLTPTCLPASGSTFAIGTTTVTCSATDAAGNTGNASFSITVQDTTPPTINQPADVSIAASGPTGSNVSYPDPITSDIVDGSGTASCTPVSGSLFPIGDTVVTCTASDSHENSAEPITFVVHVTTVPTGQPGTTTPFYQTNDAPLVIRVTGQGTALSCTEPSTTLNLAGFEVTFTNLCGYSALLGDAPVGSLHGALPDGNKFVGGIDVVLLQDGIVVNPFPADANTILSFEIPSGMAGETLAILYWDTTANSGAGAWVEKSVTVVDGKVTLTIDMPGTYVLVDKSTPTAMEESSPIAATLNDLYVVVVDFFKQFTLQ